ncbi:hypothetical protein V7A37_03895 [Lactococcus petauri]
MGISRETEDRRLKEKTSSDFQRSRILSRKEIENEVVYDAFFDPKAAPDSKLVITRVLNVLGIIIVWLVTFLPSIITLWQVFWTEEMIDTDPFFYLESTTRLFFNFSESILMTLLVVSIIIALLAAHRKWFRSKGYFSNKFQNKQKKLLSQIKDKADVLEFHFSSKLGEEAVRRHTDWIVILPEENIDTDEIELLYDYYIKKP